jgi:hypothetical protein
VQFRFVASVVVFVGSYLPLSLILLVQDFRYDLLDGALCWPFGESSTDCVLPLRNAGFSLTILACCLFCFLISLGALATTRPKIPVDILETKYIPAELMSYTLPYVVSFMSLDYQETGKFLGLIIFLAWMFLITHRSGQLILNPLLIVFGWRLYEIRYVFPSNNKEYVGRALSRQSLEPHTRYNQTVIQDVMIIRGKRPKEEG